MHLAAPSLLPLRTAAVAADGTALPAETIGLADVVAGAFETLLNSLANRPELASDDGPDTAEVAEAPVDQSSYASLVDIAPQAISLVVNGAAADPAFAAGLPAAPGSTAHTRSAAAAAPGLRPALMRSDMASSPADAVSHAPSQQPSQVIVTIAATAAPDRAGEGNGAAESSEPDLAILAGAGPSRAPRAKSAEMGTQSEPRRHPESTTRDQADAPAGPAKPIAAAGATLAPETVLAGSSAPHVGTAYRSEQSPARSMLPQTDSFALIEDIARLVDRLAVQGDVGRGTSSVSLVHRDFGTVDILFEQAGGTLEADVQARDGEAHKALAAAMAQDRSPVRPDHAPPGAQGGTSGAAEQREGDGAHAQARSDPRQDHPARQPRTAVRDNETQHSSPPRTPRPGTNSAVYA